MRRFYLGSRYLGSRCTATIVDEDRKNENKPTKRRTSGREEKLQEKPQHPGFPRGPPPWY